MRFLCCLSLLLLSLNLFAQSDSFRVSDIRVEGLQRVSAGTVFTALPIRVGDLVTQADLQSATRELFKVGYFSDVSIGRDGDVLVLVIKERPAISAIELKGNKVIKSDALLDSLKKNDLAEGQIFQRATLESIGQALQREYIGQGRYGAKVDVEVEDLPRNQVKVKINITEGAVARIKKINIVGNTRFPDEELVDLFELHASGWFSWITGNDKYSREKLRGDLETLESYYLDRGYLGFKVDSTQVSLSPEKSKIFITINVSEGDVYTVTEVDLAGDPAIDERLVRRMILTRPQQTFSQILMTTSAEYITQRLGNEGYTFAKVEGIPERNDEDKTVKITYFIEPGQRAYVNRINFRGNTKTIDEVLRREMRQMEGGSASTGQIEHSKVRLERLGFFKEVKVDTVEVPGTSDQVDVDFTVEESPSGSMGLQIGYAEYSGVIFSASVQQSNWFGTGKQVGISLSHSRYQEYYSFNYNDPYFTLDGVSRGFSLYYQKTNYSYANISGFSTDAYGGKMNFSYPISDIERLGLDIGLRNLTVKPNSNASQEIIRTPLYNPNAHYMTQEDWIDSMERRQAGLDYPAGYYPVYPVTEEMYGPPGFLDIYGSRFDDIQASLYWGKSTLNRGVLANRGASQRLGVDVSLPGGDLQYFKFDYTAQWFKPLTRQLTLRLHTRLGYGDGYGDMEDLPFFEHFYAGGFGSVRGFERNTLGPKVMPIETLFTQPSIWEDLDGDSVVDSNELRGGVGVLCQDPSSISGYACRDGRLVTSVDEYIYRTRTQGAFGGNVLIQGGAEILFPLPFIKDQRMLQTTFFVDAGNVFDTRCGIEQRNCYDVDLSRLTISSGFGLTWISGFGPMTFAIARPIRKNEYDDPKFFEFSLGQTF
jgi:outer membrane protein insertion porin family